jgi:uncharacterized protein (TIRG00374 family)
MSPHLRRLWRPLLLVAGLGSAVVAMHGRMPDPASAWAALRQASPAWLAVAVALQLVSMTAFGEQQRHLLAGFGVRISAGAALAVSYIRTALSNAVPAGEAVSAGYAFKEFRARGASQGVAAAVMVLSSAASALGLLLLYGGDALTVTTSSRHGLLITAACLTALIVAAVIGRHRHRNPAAKPAGRLTRTLRETLELAATVPAGRWIAVVAMAVLNWLTDLACFLAALQAVGLHVPAKTVATAYLIAQLVRQIPVTPGGVGVIEASLLIALTTAGAGPAPAAAAVLIYRLLSCWSSLPIGLVCWTARKAIA